MKSLPALFAALLLCQVATAQTPLTAEDRAFGLKYLTETREDLSNAVKGLSPAQLTFKADPKRWSILECLEHIALSEPAIWGMIQGALKEAPDASKRVELKFDDKKILELIVDRSAKFNAPEPLAPTGKFKDAGAALAAILEVRNKQLEFLQTTKEDLRDRVTKHPAFGPIDTFQFILFNAGHGKRHTLQIEEVKADKAFPKS